MKTFIGSPMNSYIAFGALCGFVSFVVLLESNGLGKVLWREGRINPQGLVDYIVAPFHKECMWYRIMWRHNWIVTTSVGAMIGAILGTIARAAITDV